jgi:hypothetical protein
MRRSLTLLAAVSALFVVRDASAAHQQYGFAFGRTGGNIRPYTVHIANTGIVTVRGPVVVGRKVLALVQIGRLNLKSVEVDFAHMPQARNCVRALPDVAYTFIRVGARTVRVRGTCVPGYTRLWTALARAVKLETS